jgi:hypothetical protein
MRNLNLLTVLAALLLACFATVAIADEDGSNASAASDPYYFNVSPTGKDLGENAVVESHNGRELRFADAADAAAFHAAEEKYFEQLDAKLIADQAPLYPLDVCVITDEPLDSMGGVVDYVYGNRLVRFCCAGCISEFETDPAKYLAVIDAAIVAKQGAGYPLPTCIVLPDQAFEPGHGMIVGGRLFRLCCGGCEAQVLGEPAEWVSKLDAAWAIK